MNYQLKKYPKYKPSGVEWIGEIPEGWEVKLAKWLFQERNEKNHPDERLLASTQNKGVIPKDEMEYRTVIALKNFESFKLVKENDFVISLRSFEGGFEYSEYQGIISPAYTVFCRNIITGDQKYWKYLFKSFTFLVYVRSLVKGIRDGLNINFNDFKYSSLPLPPPAEQTTIAKYLDDKTAKIDSLIEKKKKLIELYKEERTAVINHYVLGQHLIDNGQTSIDNGQLTMDNSQLSIYNYKLPKGWQVKKLKYVASKVQTGSTPPSNKDEYYIEEVNWFTPSDFSDNLLLKNSKRKISQLAINDEVVKLFPKNSVLIVGIGATLGKVGYISEEASSNQQINSISFDTLEKAKYYANFFFANQKNIVSLANAATLAILNQAQTKDIFLPIPSSKECGIIVQHIEAETKRIDSKIAKIEKEIELLQEYRTALIAEVVTGKIKVIDN